MADTPEVDGRTLLVLTGVVAVALGALVGVVVGAMSAERGADVVVFGTVTLPSSPLVIGLYAAGLGALVVGTLFGAVRLASRLERRD